MTPDEYLQQVEGQLCGSRTARKRLLAELRDHVADSTWAGHDAVALLGAPGDVTVPWRAHAVAVRAQNRRRAAVLALTVATTLALGIAQHASGHRTPRRTCDEGQRLPVLRKPAIRSKTAGPIIHIRPNTDPISMIAPRSGANQKTTMLAARKATRRTVDVLVPDAIGRPQSRQLVDQASAAPRGCLTRRQR